MFMPLTGADSLRPMISYIARLSFRSSTFRSDKSVVVFPSRLTDRVSSAYFAGSMSMNAV